MSFDCVIVGAHLRYDGVRQRPHHVVSRLARRCPVLYVEEPFLSAVEDDRIEPVGEVDVLRPLRTSLDARAFDARTIDAARRWAAGRAPLVWLYTPRAEALADAFADAPVAFDRMDDLAAFARAPEGLRDAHARVLARAGVVFAGGRSLYAAIRDARPDAHLIPSGVECAFFAGARTMRPHVLFEHLSGPRSGYVGVIDERIDFSLVTAVAERDVHVVLVGPVTKIDGSHFPRRPNVHFTGAVPYAELPAWFAGFDVALMPFARNPATAAISPTKTLEYLAAGLPVVSTPIADVAADYGDVVSLADDPAAFVEAAVAALAFDESRRARGEALARAADWNAIVERMWMALKGE